MKKIVMTQLQTKMQKRGVRTILFAAVLVVIGQTLLLLASGSSSTQQPYEAYYNYLGNYPNDAEPGWSVEAQGLAHDQENWFITQKGRLWKIPVSYNLGSVSCGGRVVCKRLPEIRTPSVRIPSEIRELFSEGYNHMGDPDYFYHELNEQGYVLVPVERPAEIGRRPAIAVFKAKDLEYVNHAYLTGQTSAGWCAVDRQGRVYSSSDNLNPVNRYAVDWGTLLSSTTPLILSNPDQIILTDESGSPVEIRHMQGGEISPSGQLLYLVAGYHDQRRPSDGIHVFDLSTRRRVQYSTNGSGYFNYEFHPGGTIREEPEGLTIWDLDDVKAPCSGGGACINGRLQGQLHVLLLDNDWPTTDDIYMKHYTGTIYVDRTYGGEERGTPSKPFKTVGKANNLAWDGAQIKIRAGSYPETLTFSKRIRVLAERETATIGQ